MIQAKTSHVFEPVQKLHIVVSIANWLMNRINPTNFRSILFQIRFLDAFAWKTELHKKQKKLQRNPCCVLHQHDSQLRRLVD